MKIKEFLDYTKSTDVGFHSQDDGWLTKQKTLEGAWDKSKSATWMVRTLERVYTPEWGDKKMLRTLIKCSELALDDIKDDKFHKLVDGNILPAIRGLIMFSEEETERGISIIHDEPQDGEMFSKENKIRLGVWKRIMYKCSDALGGLNENNKSQYACRAVESALGSALSNKRRDLEYVICYTCNTFYGQRTNKKRLRKCADIIAEAYPGKYIAEKIAAAIAKKEAEAGRDDMLYCNICNSGMAMSDIPNGKAFDCKDCGQGWTFVVNGDEIDSGCSILKSLWPSSMKEGDKMYTEEFLPEWMKSQEFTARAYCLVGFWDKEEANKFLEESMSNYLSKVK